MQQLITKEIEQALEKQGDTSDMSPDDIMVVAKFFALGSGASWYLYDWDRDTRGKDGETEEFPPRSHDDPPNRLWVFATLGDPGCAECGTVLLQELQSLRFGNIPRIERDHHFSPMPLSEVIRKVKSGGHV